MWAERPREAGSAFTFQWGSEPERHCPYAREFERWTEELAQRLLEQGTLISINQAKVLLLDQYQSWRASVPKGHQNYTGERHVCLFHVFDRFYQRLRLAELSLQPPMLFLPGSPRKRDLATVEGQPQIFGITIGERTNEP